MPTNKKTLEELLTQKPALGDGWVVGIQGSSNSGRSVLAAGAPDPILYINLDRNTAHLKKFHPGQRIDFAHLGLGPDATMADREALLAQITTLWNAFLSGAVSPIFGSPWKTVVWDTQSALWDFLYPLKVETYIREHTDRKSAMNFASANAWMKSLGESRATFRPDGNILFLLAEEGSWEQVEENGKKTWFRNDSKPVMKGWGDGEMTGTFPICRLYIRMWRKAVESDPKTGKVIKRQVRDATIKKCSDDETFLTVKEELREPVWADIQEIMDEVSK